MTPAFAGPRGGNQRARFPASPNVPDKPPRRPSLLPAFFIASLCAPLAFVFVLHADVAHEQREAARDPPSPPHWAVSAAVPAAAPLAGVSLRGGGDAATHGAAAPAQLSESVERFQDERFTKHRTAGSQAARGAAARPPPHFPHVCHVIGHNSHMNRVWLYNSRALCLTSSLCIRPATMDTLPELFFGASLSETSCTVEQPGLLAPIHAPPHYNCTELQHRRVHCAHGKYLGRIEPTCPPVRRLADLQRTDNDTADWIPAESVAVVAPALPYVENMIRFAYVVASVTHAVVSLQRLQTRWLGSEAARQNVVVVLRQEHSGLGAWHTFVFETALKRRMRAAGHLSVAVRTLGEHSENGGIDPSASNPSKLVCARSAVLLSDRGNINAWPFANGSALSHTGLRVPGEAVALRRALYSELDIASRLPEVPDGGRGFPARTKFDLPPRVLAYARRETGPDPPPGEPVTGSTRRFSDADDAWFAGMLHEEGMRGGLEVRELQVSGSDSVSEQIGSFAEVGFVAGIHGANLANALFMRPFGALLEIVPFNTKVACYEAGSNGGLAYFRHEAQMSSLEESHCPPKDEVCRMWPRGRRVKIEDAAHREHIRELVRRGVRHINDMHRRFPDGVPVRYDPTMDEFVVDDNGAAQ